MGEQAKQVGFLTYAGRGWAVLCSGCASQRLRPAPLSNETAKANGMTPIFDVNILPYRQTCHQCTLTLVAGQSPAWCELYTGE